MSGFWQLPDNSVPHRNFRRWRMQNLITHTHKTTQPCCARCFTDRWRRLVVYQAQWRRMVVTATARKIHGAQASNRTVTEPISERKLTER